MAAFAAIGASAAFADDGDNLWAGPKGGFQDDGVSVVDNKLNAVIVPDSTGGAYFASSDLPTTSICRLSEDGDVLWFQGIPVGGFQNQTIMGRPAIAPLADGCYVVAARGEIAPFDEDLLFVQRYDGDGNEAWIQPVQLNDGTTPGYTDQPSVALFTPPTIPPQPPVLWVGMGNGRIATVTESGIVTPINGFSIDSEPGAGPVCLISDGQPFGGIYTIWQRGDRTIAAQYFAGFPVQAQWPQPLTLNSPFSDPGNGGIQAVASDGAGGFFVVWSQLLSGSPDRLYVQRADSMAQLRFGTSGVFVYSGSFQGGELSATRVDLTHDGDGGAIVAWADSRNQNMGDVNYDDVFAQRVDSEGAIMWQFGGVPLAPEQDEDGAPGAQNEIRLAPDGQGGAVALYTDWYWPFKSVSATRISHEGEIVWSQWLAPAWLLDPNNDDYEAHDLSYNGYGAVPESVFAAYHSVEHGMLAGKIDLTAPPPHPADLNGDGAVNGADLAELLSQFGGPGTADLNGDGIVDGADLAELLAAWDDGVAE